ncbi:unnamed protein product [Urochloa decumbens]|uniref:Protein kinase domain-containing protein n=1 Tax=Urochloa decumbens TaxID=240449 RepID=A0ABC9F7Q1_9POAL
MEVLDISLPDGTVRISSNVLRSDSLEFNGSWSVPDATGPFKVSSSRNSFVAFGCNVVAQLIPHSTLGSLTYASICAAMCPETLSGSSCSGVACCRTSIAAFAGDLPSYGIQVKHLVGQRDHWQVPTAAFIVDQDWFSRSETEMMSNFISQFRHPVVQSAPMVLEWSLDLISDEGLFRLSPIGPVSSDFICLSPNSFSYLINGNYDRRRCSCSQGYQGNTYLTDGCQDIDECQQPDLYPCHGTCINLPGTYRCSSKKSIRNLPGLITIIAISAGFGLLFSLLGVAKITNKLKKRRAKKLRQIFFKRNHGLLLQQLISSNKDIAERMKIFSLEELDQATNKFDQNRILGGGGHGTVYKGILSDQRVVAIKKSKIVVQREVDQFINEVSDFGASRSISIDETGILTAIQGTHGYLDPEYYYTSRLTEKSDVYSFGVILAELLTRFTPVFSSHSSEVTSLASHFVSLKRDNRLQDILDPQIVEEGGTEDAKAVARLAEACLNLKGEERPTMRQVETILEDVRSSKVHHNSQTTRVGQNVPKYQSRNEGTRLYSLEKEFIESSEIPR